MAYLFVALFIVAPLLVLVLSVSRTLRSPQTAVIAADDPTASRWGAQVGPSLREHQRQASAKRRPSPFAQPPAERLMAGQRPALGAVPARLRQSA